MEQKSERMTEEELAKAVADLEGQLKNEESQAEAALIVVLGKLNSMVVELKQIAEAHRGTEVARVAKKAISGLHSGLGRVGVSLDQYPTQRMMDSEEMTPTRVSLRMSRGEMSLKSPAHR